jgi:hypothetical protein
MIKRWVTGEQAEMDQDDNDRDSFELAREWMKVSKLKKLPAHVAKETYVALCKQFREYPKQKDAILVLLFRCPLRHQCGFLAGIRNMEGADWMQLIGAASTMQTVTMKISPSISSTTHNRSLLDMIIMDLSLTVCVFHLAGRELRHDRACCQVVPTLTGETQMTYVRRCFAGDSSILCPHP